MQVIISVSSWRQAHQRPVQASLGGKRTTEPQKYKEHFDWTLFYVDLQPYDGLTCAKERCLVELLSLLLGLTQRAAAAAKTRKNS